MTHTLDSLPQRERPYRLIAIDLDGTLLRDDKTISQRTIDTLNRAKKLGLDIAVATGRHPKSAVRYMRELGCLDEHSFTVCFNGAAVVSLRSYCEEQHEVGFSTVISTPAEAAPIREVAAFAHSMGCKVHGYSCERGLLIESENPYSLRESELCQVPYIITDFEKLPHYEHMFKVLMVGPEEKLDKLRAEVPPYFSEFFAIMRSDPNFIEFIPHHSTKGTALAALCKHLGYDISDAIAVGDAENDLAMVKAAGLGVAMANADEILKQAATVITASNQEDGVAQLVERLFKL